MTMLRRTIKTVEEFKHKKREAGLSGPLNFLSSGVTLLNLAMTDNPDQGFQAGKIVNIIGDSSAGKTLLALTGCAEASNNIDFNDYLIIYDDTEEACEFDISALFGQKTADRIQPPKREEKVPIYSDTVWDFQSNVLRYIKGGKPFIYILDSFDALTMDEEMERAEKRMKGKEVKSYATEKARAASEVFRTIVRGLKGTKSILIILSQTRENLDPMSFQKKTRAGGKALEFYSSHIMWLLLMGQQKKAGISIGGDVLVKLTKNKITGKKREIKFSAFPDYGIDDIGAMVDYLLGTADRPGRWDKAEKSAAIDCHGDLGITEKITRTKLIQQVEEGGLVKKLRLLVAEYWQHTEDSVRLNRQRRYE